MSKEHEVKTNEAHLAAVCNPNRIARIALGTRLKKDKTTGEFLRNDAGGFVREPIKDVSWDKAEQYPGVNRIITFNLPDSRFQESKRFGPDEYGVDRDLQTPMINVPSSWVRLNLIRNETGKPLFFKGAEAKEAKNIMMGLNRRLYRRDTLEDVTDKYTVNGLYFYLTPDREYNIYFSSKDGGRSGKGAKATGQEIHKMFQEEKEKRLEKEKSSKNKTKKPKVKKQDVDR